MPIVEWMFLWLCCGCVLVVFLRSRADKVGLGHKIGNCAWERPNEDKGGLVHNWVVLCDRFVQFQTLNCPPREILLENN